MKHLLFLLAGITVSGIASAQRLMFRGHPRPAIAVVPKSLPSDTSIKINPFNRSVPNTGIPNAITTPLLPDVYVGNNGQGQDIYRSQLDNMSILKPDSNYHNSIPNTHNGVPLPYYRRIPLKGYPRPGTNSAEK